MCQARRIFAIAGPGPVSREFGGLLFFAVLALLAGELWYTRRLVARGV